MGAQHAAVTFSRIDTLLDILLSVYVQLAWLEFIPLWSKARQGANSVKG